MKKKRVKIVNIIGQKIPDVDKKTFHIKQFWFDG